MDLSDEGAAFIAHEEGISSSWYKDALGNWTIGIGHVWNPDTDQDFEYRDLSVAEIWDLFRADAERYIASVNDSVTVPLTQTQFDRLVSFAFNWGISPTIGFPATSIVRLLNAGDFAAAAADLVDGKGPGGRPYDKGIAGVRARRIREADPFKTPGGTAMPTPVQIIEAVGQDLEAAGHEVWFEDGWQGRATASLPRLDPQGLVIHHTATNRYAAGDYPSLALVRDGRSDLAGPLAQFGLGRSGRVYVIAAGKANHAGEGGWNGLAGNFSVWGIEAENDGIGEPWPASQVSAYIALATALARHTGFGAEMICRHAEWTPYKIDPATAPMNDGDWFRAEVAARLADEAPTQEPPTPEPFQEVPTVFIFDGPQGGIYATDGDRKWGVPNRSYLDAFFFNQGGRVPHLGTLPQDAFDALRDRGADEDAPMQGPVASLAPEPMACADQ